MVRPSRPTCASRELPRNFGFLVVAPRTLRQRDVGTVMPLND